MEHANPELHLQLQDANAEIRLQVSFAISTAAEEAAAAAQKPASKKRARPSG